MIRVLFLAVLLMAMSRNCIHCQSSIHTSATLTKSVQSAEGHSYELLINLPPKYDNEKEYKVLYYLDAWWLTELVNGSYRINDLTKEMEELILVGISINGDEEAWHEQRNRDYTPSIYDEEKMKFTMKGGPFELNEQTTGGGEKFITFLEEVVFDEIESKFKINKEERGILGHSFGGLFAYYCLVAHADLFRNYILISPAIWWNKSEFLANEFVINIISEANIYVVMGMKESNLLKRPIKELEEELMRVDKGLGKMVFKEYEGKDHHSILSIGIYEGLEVLFRLE